jgi:hypothetical protein
VRPEPGYGNTYQSIVWYVPDSLEICQGVDCGGGRAPPKKVPGCPLYEGTETVTPSFLKSDPMKTDEPTAEATATAPEVTSTSAVEESDDVAEQTTEDAEEPKETSTEETSTKEHEHKSSTITSAMVTVTTTPAVISTASETPTTPGAPDNGEDGEAPESATNTPDAAMPTAMVGLNLLAGVVAAIALM